MKRKYLISISISLLLLGVLFFMMILTSNGGLNGNSRMAGASWFFIVSAIFGFVGYKFKGCAIAMVVLLYIGTAYNIVMTFEWKSNFLLAIISLVLAIVVNVKLGNEREIAKSDSMS